MADIKLKKYIKKQLDKGFDSDTVKEVLIDNGWDHSEVNSAFNEVGCKSNARLLIIPLIVIFGLVSILFLTEQESPSAYTVAEINGIPCLRYGEGDFNYKVDDVKQCCDLIRQTDICKQVEGASSSYKEDEASDYTGEYSYDYVCSGGNAKRIVFTENTKEYCNLDI